MRGIRQVEVVKVIKTNTVIGKGTEEDPVRGVIQYWDMEGHMIAEEDDHEESRRLASSKASSASI